MQGTLGLLVVGEAVVDVVLGRVAVLVLNELVAVVVTGVVGTVVEAGVDVMPETPIQA